MTQDQDRRSAFFRGLDQTERVLATMGLVLTVVVCATGVAGLIYVALNVLRTSPPDLGSQGEWVYGGVAALLVAGWGLGQALRFADRLRPARPPAEDLRLPKFQIGAHGLSIELPPLQAQDRPTQESPGSFTWSFTSEPTPFKTIKLDDAQLAATEAAVAAGADWDEVCRQLSLEYATWSPFEQSLYRQAVQSAIETMRGSRPE